MRMKMKMMVVEAQTYGGATSDVISTNMNNNNIGASKVNANAMSNAPSNESSSVTTSANFYRSNSTTKYDPEEARFNSNNGYYRALGHSKMDTNIIIVTASLLVVLVCSLCMHFAIRWALARFCFRHTSSSPNGSSPDQEAAPGMKKRHVEALPTFVFADLGSIVRHVAAAKCNDVVDNVNSVNTNANNVNNNINYHFSIDSCCPICLVDFTPSDRIRLLPCTCHHPFHVSCIDPWLSKHSSCPTCRSNLLPSVPASVTALPASHVIGATSMPPGSTTTININASSPSQPPTQFQLHILISPSHSSPSGPSVSIPTNDKHISHHPQLPIMTNDKQSSFLPQHPTTSSDEPKDKTTPPPNP